MLGTTVRGAGSAAGAWEETSAGMRQEHTALEVSQRRHPHEVETSRHVCPHPTCAERG